MPSRRRTRATVPGEQATALAMAELERSGFFWSSPSTRSCVSARRFVFSGGGLPGRSIPQNLRGEGSAARIHAGHLGPSSPSTHLGGRAKGSPSIRRWRTPHSEQAHSRREPVSGAVSVAGGTGRRYPGRAGGRGGEISWNWDYQRFSITTHSALFNQSKGGSAVSAKPKPKSSQPKPGPEKPGRPKKKSPYPEEIRAAAKAVRAMLPENAKSPGPLQVQRTVKALAGRDPVEASGIAKGELGAWAVGGERPADFAKLQELAKEVGDPFATSRKLAAILTALDAGAKPEKAKAEPATPKAPEGGGGE
jgi:hypothetical protein